MAKIQDEILTVKISQRQKERLRELAAEKGLGMSAYVRLLIAEATEK